MPNDSTSGSLYRTYCTEVAEHGGEYPLGDWENLDEANRAGKDHEVESRGHRWRIEVIAHEVLAPPFFEIPVPLLERSRFFVEPVSGTTIAAAGAAIIGILKKGIDDLSREIGEWMEDLKDAIEDIEEKLDQIIDLLRRLDVRMQEEFETFVRRSLESELNTYFTNASAYVADRDRWRNTIDMQYLSVQRSARLAMGYGYAADLTLCTAYRSEFDLQLLAGVGMGPMINSADAYLAHFEKSLDPDEPGSIAARLLSIEQAVEARRSGCPTLREHRIRWPNAVSWTEIEVVDGARGPLRHKVTFQEDFDVVVNGSLAEDYSSRVEFHGNVRAGNATPLHGRNQEDARARGTQAASGIVSEWNRLRSEYEGLLEPSAQMRAAHSTIEIFAGRIAGVRAALTSAEPNVFAFDQSQDRPAIRA